MRQIGGLVSVPAVAEADEVARIACCLLSDDARYITGQVVQVDDGLAM